MQMGGSDKGLQSQIDQNNNLIEQKRKSAFEERWDIIKSQGMGMWQSNPPQQQNTKR